MSCRKSMTLLFSCFPHPLSDATNNGPPPSEMGAKPSGHTKTLLVRQRREEAYQRILKTLFQRMAADMPTAIFFRKEEWLECCQTVQLFAFLEAGLIFSMVTLTSGRMEILFCLCGRRRGTDLHHDCCSNNPCANTLFPSSSLFFGYCGCCVGKGRCWSLDRSTEKWSRGGLQQCTQVDTGLPVK